MARSAIGVLGLRFAQRGLSVVRLIVLARLLDPRAFGLVGIAMLVMDVLESSTDSGVHPALIQRRRDPTPLFDSAWTVLLIRRMASAGFMVALAPVVAGFFDTPAATAVIQVMALALVADALVNIGVVHLQRAIAFRRIVVLEGVATVVELVVAIAWAVVARNVWALVAGVVAGRATQAVLSYVVHPYRPRLALHRSHLRELFRFGRWIYVSRVALFFATHLDDLVVGRVLGAADLGRYQLAYRIGSMPATEVAHVVNRVAFPAYARMQDDLPRLRAAFLRSFRVVVTVVILAGVVIAVLADPFVRTLLGTDWVPAVPALRLLGLYGALRGIGAVSGSLFVAAGRPDLDGKLAMVSTVLLVASLWPLVTTWGITGAAWAIVSTAALNRVFSLTLSSRLLALRSSDWVEALGPGLLTAVAAAVAGVAAVGPLSGWPALALGGAAMPVAAVLLHYLLWRMSSSASLIPEVISLVRDLRGPVSA